MNKQHQPPRRGGVHIAVADELALGIASFRRGQLAEAERRLQGVVARAPQTAEALLILGLIAARAGRMPEAERLLRRCLGADPRHADAHNNLGNVLLASGRLQEARDQYAHAALLAPRNPLPQYNLGNVLRALGQLSQAEAAYRQALALDPGNIDARINLGNLLAELGDEEEAEALALAVLRQHPDRHEVRLNLGNIYGRRGRVDQARAQYQQLLDARPGHPRALLSMAMVALAEHDLGEAEHLITQAQRAGSVPPHELFTTQAMLYAGRQDLATAIAAARLAYQRGGGQQALILADLLGSAGQTSEGVQVLEDSLARHGERTPRALSLLFGQQGALCDWRQWSRRIPALVERIRVSRQAIIEPFLAQSVPGLTESDLQQVARLHAQRFMHWVERGPLWRSGVQREEPSARRLRLGYLSADLREHPTAYLSAGVFELHDRERFEVFAYTIGPDDEGPMRQRMRGAFDHFVDLNPLTHEGAARRILADGIDILVDLGGYTRHARPEILALRPAPIQVTWIGYPGTLGAPFIDYQIADSIVAPPSQAGFHDEALAYLPHCYLPLDHRREMAGIPSRTEQDLPEEGMVFASFNRPEKITPELFGRWCALLKDVPDSVLWLLVKDESARENLRHEARSLGLDPARLRFASSCPQPDHLARLALADLMLDTLPYGGHTTTSDALWAGVPVMTCLGDTWPSRVAASLLTAAGVPDLVAKDLDEYVTRARHLADRREELASIRRRLLEGRLHAPLFDATGLVQALEGLYATMWLRHLAGQVPASLSGGSARD